MNPRNQPQSRPWSTAGFALLPVIALCVAAAPPTASAPGSPGGTLGAVYTDPVFGFSLRPPVDAVPVTVRRSDSRTRLERVRFAVEPKRWAMTVSIHAAAGSTTPSAILDALRDERQNRVGDVRVDARSEQRVAARDAATGSFRLRVGGADWIEHVTVVAMPPNRSLVLRLESPDASSSDADRALAATLATLRFPGSELTDNIVSRATLEGRSLLERVKQRLGTLQLLPETYLRITREGRNVGLVRRTEQRVSDGTTTEIVVEVHTFSFSDDEPPRESRSVTRTNHNLSSEHWEYEAWTARPDPDGRLMRQPVEIDRGLRERSMLALSFTSTPGQMLLANAAREVPAGYFPQAVIRLLPRLVDLGKPAIYAFPCYSRELRGIVTRIVRTGGEEFIDVDGKSINAYRISDRETVLGPDTHSVVDEAGHLLRVVRGRETFIPIAKTEAERMLHDRLAAYRAAAARRSTTAPSSAPSEP